MQEIKDIIKNDIKFTTKIIINGKTQKKDKLNLEQIGKLLKFYNKLMEG